MKTFKLLTSALLIVVVALAAGCGSDSPTAPGPVPPPPPPSDGVNRQVVGVWMFTEAKVDGQSSSLGSVLEWESATVVAAFEIGADGSYAYAEFDENLEVTYYVEGSITTDGDQFNISAEDQSFGGTWTRNGAQLTLSTEMDGSRVSLIAENLDEATSRIVVSR